MRGLQDQPQALVVQPGAVSEVEVSESEAESEAESDDVGYGSYLTFLNGVPRPFMQRVKIECRKMARIAFPAAVATASRYAQTTRKKNKK